MYTYSEIQIIAVYKSIKDKTTEEASRNTFTKEVNSAFNANFLLFFCQNVLFDSQGYHALKMIQGQTLQRRLCFTSASNPMDLVLLSLLALMQKYTNCQNRELAALKIVGDRSLTACLILET